MQKREDKDQRQELATRPDLDDRYGKIGISAVAAAVRRQPSKQQQQQTQGNPHRVPFDRD